MNAEAHILLVEDDEVDIMGMKRALKALKIANTLHIANDGIQALELLRGQSGKQKIELPFIILLDLNMPRMGGLEFLEEIRNDAELNNSIVFVMTTSSDEQDICAAYKKNIAGYIVKSNAQESFSKALGLIEHYWRVIELPPKS